MERLIYVPIERLEERYSAQWDEWFKHAFDREGINYIHLGDHLNHKIKDGEFLDVVSTNVYKCRQMSRILEIIQKDPKIPTSIFFMDLWFPSIEMLAYIRDGLGAPIKISGMLHAGAYDEHDFLHKKGMWHWAHHFEQSLINIVDKIFLATDFHKKLIWNDVLELPQEKIRYVEWPVETDFKEQPKLDWVVFPHRLAEEKQPKIFTQMHNMYNAKYGNDARWIFTKGVAKTKAEYYDLLACSKVAVSTALQETYGIAMVEAVNNGCIPVAPNRLSYPEVLRGHTLYNNLDEAVELIHKGLTEWKRPAKLGGKEIPWLKELLLHKT